MSQVLGGSLAAHGLLRPGVAFNPVVATGGDSTYEFIRDDFLWKAHVFNGSGDFVVTDAGDDGQVDVLVVGGGGGAGSGGGGGGGYHLTSAVLGLGEHVVIIGGGGFASPDSSSTGGIGNSSSFKGFTSGGGGGGGRGSGGAANGTSAPTGFDARGSGGGATGSSVVASGGVGITAGGNSGGSEGGGGGGGGNAFAGQDGNNSYGGGGGAGRKVDSGDFYVCGGGMGANVADAASLPGPEPALGGGKDHYGGGGDIYFVSGSPVIDPGGSGLVILAYKMAPINYFEFTHGADPEVARPLEDYVRWIGSVMPDYPEQGDLWTMVRPHLTDYYTFDGEFWVNGSGGRSKPGPAMRPVFTTTAVNQEVRIPLTGTVNVTVDWGDGTSPTSHTDAPVHTYAAAGTYEVVVTGTAAGLFNTSSADARWQARLTGMYSLGRLGITNLSWAWRGCTSLTNLDIAAWDVSNVTTLSQAWLSCTSLTSLDLSAWDVSSVTTLRDAWADCSSLTSLDLSAWDVSNVTTLLQTWWNCTSLTSLDIAAWNVANVTTLFNAWHSCSSLTSLDIAGWNVSSVTSLQQAWSDCSSLTSLDIAGWNVSKVTRISRAWHSCSSLTSLDIAAWDVSRVTLADNALVNVTLTTTSYSSILEGWGAQVVKSDVPFHGGDSKYNDTNGATGRASLVSQGWTITDGGPA